MGQVDEIIAAATAGQVHEVALLLDLDASLATASTMLGSQAIHAAHFAGHAPVVDLLLSRGVSIDPFLAADLGMLERVQAAVSLNPDLTRAFDANGSTALHRACYWGQFKVAEFLLTYLADPNAATRDGFLQIRPLGCAVATPDVTNPSMREEVVLDLVRLLLHSGANVNGRRRDGLTALHSAAHRGHTSVIAYLLEHGADPGIRGYDGVGPHSGHSALDVATAQKQAAAVALLTGARYAGDGSAIQ